MWIDAHAVPNRARTGMKAGENSQAISKYHTFTYAIGRAKCYQVAQCSTTEALMARKAMLPQVPKASDRPEVPMRVREQGPVPRIATPVGRPRIKPSTDDPEAIQRLCDRLIGGMSMTAACADPLCPSEQAVYRRMAHDAEFYRLIARAREAQQHAIIDQTVDMADAATPENWQMVRLQIWARQWRAAKLAPRIYGERTTTTVEGEITLMTPEQRQARIAALQRKRGVVLEGEVTEAD